ncbi:MAG: PIN domain-containing protein, partial [Chloroflexota bacterium]|nr:PIN domain-containing protein [Chloroflexota bacterium]
SKSAVLIAKLRQIPREQRFTSSIMIGELIYGAHRPPGQTEKWLESFALSYPQDMTVLPFDEASARRYGELRATLERLGTPIGDADTRIATIALARRLIMITGNVRYFGRVPNLRVENCLA